MEMSQMTAFTGFLQQNFGAVVTLLVAFVPFFVTVVTVLGSRTGKIATSLDTQIKVRKIERRAVEPGTWEELSLLELRRAVLVVVLSVLIVALLVIFHELVDLVIIILLIVLFIIIVSRTVLNFVTSPYKFRCKDPQAAKFYVFEDVSISVEGQRGYLFAKAQQAVLGKHIKLIEVDADNQEIKAYFEGDTTTTQGTISVKFLWESPEPECNHCTIKINFTPAPYNLISLIVQVIAGLSTFPSYFSTFLEKRTFGWVIRSPKEDAKVKHIEAQSKIVNYFISNFLAATAAKK